MKQKVYGVFSNIDDAKSAIGRIKKESFNLADLTVIFADQSYPELKEPKEGFEFATEYFIETTTSQPSVWPGIRERNLTGVGKIQIGSSSRNLEEFELDEPRRYGLEDKDVEIIEREVRANKILTIIEAESELLPKLRIILESSGGDIAD